MEILSRPYDSKEYGELLHEVSDRKLRERDRELRGGRKSYPLESVGKSYLDQHLGKFLVANTIVSHIFADLILTNKSHDVTLTERPTYKKIFIYNPILSNSAIIVLWTFTFCLTERGKLFLCFPQI